MFLEEGSKNARVLYLYSVIFFNSLSDFWVLNLISDHNFSTTFCPKLSVKIKKIVGTINTNPNESKDKYGTELFWFASKPQPQINYAKATGKIRH